MSFWEDGSFAEYFSNQSDKFQKETAQYLAFMEQRHKIATLDYIAGLEHLIKMQKSEIDHLKKISEKHFQYTSCNTCGKPMEDRGAATQWCKGCYDKQTKPTE